MRKATSLSGRSATDKRNTLAWSVIAKVRAGCRSSFTTSDPIQQREDVLDAWQILGHYRAMAPTGKNSPDARSGEETGIVREEDVRPKDAAVADQHQGQTRRPPTAPRPGPTAALRQRIAAEPPPPASRPLRLPTCAVLFAGFGSLLPAACTVAPSMAWLRPVRRHHFQHENRRSQILCTQDGRERSRCCHSARTSSRHLLLASSGAARWNRRRDPTFADRIGPIVGRRQRVRHFGARPWRIRTLGQGDRQIRTGLLLLSHRCCGHVVGRLWIDVVWRIHHRNHRSRRATLPRRICR